MKLILIKKFLFFLFVLTIEINNITVKLNESEAALNSVQKLVKKNNLKKQFRFESIDKNDEKENMDKNIFLLNSEILNAKPPADKEEEETQVFPQQANAGSEFIWKYLWWTLMYFPAKNALKKNNSTYWLSKRMVQQDHWEAQFDTPQKLDVIEIHWRLPPKRFRVFIKLDEKSDYIPVTESFEKTSFINNEGKVSSPDAISEYNAVIFNKPIFARRVRINLDEPIKQHSFSIFSVNFFQKKETMIIKNELVDPSQHYCFFLNTNLPRNGIKVKAYPCVKALALSNNNEMWIYNTDSSIKHYNSKFCLGFDEENELVLRQCDDYKAAFTIQFRNDNTLYFTGYEDKCIIMEDMKKISNNMISSDTEIIVTTQADDQSFKKENLVLSRETLWYSAPGQKKATLQILFGKIATGPFKGKYELKKIDLMKIDWVRPPKKFMVYSWKPGYSWELVQVYEDYKAEISEIEFIGVETSAIMLVLEEAHTYQELGNRTTYAIKEISISYNGITLKNAKCDDSNTKFKIFDFDPQNYHKLENKKEYDQVRKKLSNSFEKNVANYKNLNSTLSYITKAKLKSRDLTEKLDKIKHIISDEALKKLTDFKSTILSNIKNAMFEQFVRVFGKELYESILKQYSGEEKLGTKNLPAIDCLSIKKLQKYALSGWYYIKPECTPKPLRVFCDFTIFGDATDFYIFNDESKESNPDLSYLNIKDFNSVRYQCAKLGLHPLQINNSATVERVYQVLNSVGYNLAEPIAIPLGYDYYCSNGKCSGIINSLNDRQTPTISSFFADIGKNGQANLIVKPGAFAGLGYSETHSMIKFNSDKVKISALICSTNHFKTDSSDDRVQKISCELSPEDGNTFREGGSILVECPPSCQNSQKDVYGTNTYHLKSSICKAALHSGALDNLGGKVSVRIGVAIASYSGSTSNGVTSEDYNKNDGMNSFSLLKYKKNCPISQFNDISDKSQTEGNLSSFVETFTLTQYKFAREKFDADMKSNELEGVDSDDLHKAGMKANNPNTDFNKNDYDSEDEEYNKTHSSGDNNIQIDNKEEKTFTDSSNGNKKPEVFKFSQSDSEVKTTNDSSEMGIFDKIKGAANSLKDKVSAGASGLVNNVKNQASNLVNKAKNTATGFVDKATNAATDLVDKATNENSDLIDQAKNAGKSLSESSNKENADEPPKMDDLSDSNINNINNEASDPIKNETNDSNNNNEQISKRNSLTSNVQNDLQSSQVDPNSPNTPIPPPDNSKLPEAPRPPSPPDDEPKKKTNQRREPSTDEGNKLITKIRKATDYEYLDQLKKKTFKVKKMIENYQKSLAWSKEGSKLSNSYMKKNLILVEKYKTEVLLISKSLGEESEGRVARTKKLTEYWREKLNKEESKDAFKIDYSAAPEILFKEIFVVNDTKSNIKSNWNIVKENIKGTPRAIGITSKIYSNSQLAASTLSLYGKQYFDFHLSVDILVKSSGTAGIIFRMLNDYNFYAFSIDKDRGTKSILKVVNGKKIILKEVNDGGILINNWHHLSIQATSDNIKVHIYDSEQQNKTASEKIIKSYDATFVSGGIGLFVNNMEGFYFDKLTVNSDNCWTPWVPMENLEITTPMSSVYIEDFSGTISEKFFIIEPESFSDGPSDWKMNKFYTANKPVGLTQSSLVYDNLASRKPSMLILKNKIFKNGVIMISFTPLVLEGIISIVFKYKSQNNSEEFYLFEMVASKSSPELILRRFSNGIVREIASVSKKIKDLPVLGFKTGVIHKVQIEDLNSLIKIRMSINNSPLVEIISVTDNSISHGLIGIGTFQAKAVFSRIEMFPPQLSLSEEDKNIIMRTDSNTLFFPSLPTPPPKGDHKMDSSIKNDENKNKIRSGSTNGLKLTSDKAKDDNSALLGWNTCITNATTEMREKYCERNPVEVIRNNCKNNYCDVCCNEHASKNNKNSLYSCKKACTKATLSQMNQEDYKFICISSGNPVSNIYGYCEKKLKDEPEKKKICKLDMCNLCCSTMDQMMNRQYSFESTENCYEECSKKFNS